MDQANAGAIDAETDTNDALVTRLIVKAPAGMFVDIGLLDEWRESLATDHEQPPPYVPHPNPGESDAERDRREAAMIAAGLASLDAGRVVDSADVDAWIDSIGTSHERPAPRPRG